MLDAANDWLRDNAAGLTAVLLVAVVYFLHIIFHALRAIHRTMKRDYRQRHGHDDEPPV